LIGKLRNSRAKMNKKLSYRRETAHQLHTSMRIWFWTNLSRSHSAHWSN